MRIIVLLPIVLLAILLAGCRNQVVVMGVIHGDHRESDEYSIARVQEVITNVAPDYVLCEIPPDRFDAAWAEFEADGTVTEPRVKLFPEYTEGLFPLAKEMGITIIPCAAWTKDMADERRAKLEQWSESRADDSSEVARAQDQAQASIAEEGDSDDPAFIHTGRYDEIVEAGLEPYDRLFNDDLGAGGWANINAAHYALIEAALDEHSGEGKRVLIMFGAWHKYWFIKELTLRSDIKVESARQYLQPPPPKALDDVQFAR